MNILSVIILTAFAFLMAAPENVTAAPPAVTRDPFAPSDPSDPQPLVEEPKHDPVGITINYEAFSLPIAKASELQRKGMNDTALYKELIKSSKLEKMLTIKANSGHRPSAENGSKYVYPNPTEFGPPSGIGSSNLPAGTQPVPPPKRLPIPFTPTVFTNALMGDSIQMDPVLADDAKSVSMGIAVSHVRLVRRVKWGKGIEEREQPLFENRSLNIQVTATHGMPVFIGTLSPVFGNGVADRKEQEIWFAFITVNFSDQMPVKLDNAKAKP